MTLTVLLLSCLYTASAQPAPTPPGEGVEQAPPAEVPVSPDSEASPDEPQVDPNDPEQGPTVTTEPPSDGETDPTAEPETLPNTPPNTPEDPPVEPSLDAMEHLTRAQELKAAGSLGPAEAEVSVAISLQPRDAAAYLERAQIRMALAETSQGDDLWIRRERAALLRQAAQDVGAYLEHAQLAPENVTWFESRQEALLREADALDPPAPEPAPAPRPEPEPVPTTLEPAIDPGLRDTDHRRRSRALWGTGAVLGAGAAGLAAASLAIEQDCNGPLGTCSVRWRAHTPYLAPAVALSALGTTSIVLGVLDSPGLDRPRTRKIATTTTLVLGSTATALGTVTAAIAGALYRAPISPSDDAGLRTNQAIANASATSFAVAIPLLSAGLTAWLGSRRAQRSTHGLARR